MQKISYLDLFAGCGGLTEGFERDGNYEMKAAVEWVKTARDTLVKRMRTKWGREDAEDIVTWFDIQRTDELFAGWNDPKYQKHNGLDSLIGTSSIDLIIGGPPCQAYSIAGRVRDSNGMQNDYRNYLFESFIKVVNKYSPRFILFENVPGMLSAKPNNVKITELIDSQFKSAGYALLPNLKDAVYDVSEYGVPQKRKRVIIFAVSEKHYGDGAKKMVDQFYTSLNEMKCANIKTVREAFKGLPSFTPLDDYIMQSGKRCSYQSVNRNKDSNHNPRFHNKRDIETFKILCEDIESGENKYVSIEALKKLYTARTGKESAIHKYHVIRWDQTSNLIPAHLYKDGLRHIHPDSKQARSITVREAALLQSFPRDFEFLGSLGDQYKMVGNAVPPDFAEFIAKALRKLI